MTDPPTSDDLRTLERRLHDELRQLRADRYETRTELTTARYDSERELRAELYRSMSRTDHSLTNYVCGFMVALALTWTVAIVALSVALEARAGG